MAEIGYHARVSASAVETLFENREQLINSLGDHTFGKINELIASITQAPGTFEQRYFKLCNALIQHYRSNRDVISFLDHFGNFPFNVDGVKKRESRMISLMIDFFSEYPLMGQTLSAATVANLFHENIKIMARSENVISENEIAVLASMFFKAMEQPQSITVQPLEAA